MAQYPRRHSSQGGWESVTCKAYEGVYFNTTIQPGSRLIYDHKPLVVLAAIYTVTQPLTSLKAIQGRGHSVDCLFG